MSTDTHKALPVPGVSGADVLVWLQAEMLASDCPRVLDAAGSPGSPGPTDAKLQQRSAMLSSARPAEGWPPP